MLPSNETSLPGNMDDDRGPPLRIFIIALIVITTSAIAMRFWSRTMPSGGYSGISNLWWDDWVALASLPPLVAVGALILDMIRLGFGRHIWAIPPENVMGNLKRLFAVYYLYHTGLAIAKCSCLLFYTRMFGRPYTYRWFSRAIWASHTLIFAVLVGQYFVTTFNCSPEAQLKGGYGANIAKIWLAGAVCSVLVDLVLLLLPLPVIWKLRIGTKRKIAIFCIFISGYCVVVVSLGRLISISKAKEMAKDLSYEGITPVYWQAAEGPMTVCCVCLPSMLNLARRMYRAIFTPLCRIWETQKSIRFPPRVVRGNYTPPEFKYTPPSTIHCGDSTDGVILAPTNAETSCSVQVARPESAYLGSQMQEAKNPGIHVHNEVHVTHQKERKSSESDDCISLAV
ncbi:hypothetical protein EJ04DRAFT_572412 [Polyplosphaeria fusca]|uniref:Rhodopsin domain-containing protein n=1 Tax=Polyplosphaeria fusca TaxID=682080 RepID=A0A9P4V6R7_9PLEO|nr:hypothetical protein EJ04DRAFT_572412 [Polyplosphaeria fusca]